MSRSNWIDATYLAGLALVATGVGCWSVPAALIITGLVLLISAVVGAFAQ